MKPMSPLSLSPTSSHSNEKEECLELFERIHKEFERQRTKTFITELAELDQQSKEITSTREKRKQMAEQAHIEEQSILEAEYCLQKEYRNNQHQIKLDQMNRQHKIDKRNLKQSFLNNIYKKRAKYLKDSLYTRSNDLDSVQRYQHYNPREIRSKRQKELAEIKSIGAIGFPSAMVNGATNNEINDDIIKLLVPLAFTDELDDSNLLKGLPKVRNRGDRDDFQLPFPNGSAPPKKLNGIKLPSIDHCSERLTHLGHKPNTLPYIKPIDQGPTLDYGIHRASQRSNFAELATQNKQQEWTNEWSKHRSKSIVLSNREYPPLSLKENHYKRPSLPTNRINVQNQNYKNQSSFLNSIQKVSIQNDVLVIGGNRIVVGDSCYLHDSGTRLSVTIKSMDELGVYVQRVDGSKSRIWLELLLNKRVSLIKKI